MGTETNSKGSSPDQKPRTFAPTPRRVVLLTNDRASEVERVLVEYGAAEAPAANLSADVQRFADEYRGRNVAAEWQGPLGWFRFLWCCKKDGA
jgi:hypothetical protein